MEVRSEGFRERREDFAGKLENDLLWNLRGWGGLDGDLVGSRKWAEWCTINVLHGSVVPLSIQLHSKTKNFLAQFLNSSDIWEVLSEIVLSGPFFTVDGLFLWFFPGSKVFGPDSSEGDRSAFKSQPVDGLLWWLPSDLERWLFTSEINFNFSTDWSVDLGNDQDLQTTVDNWGPDLNAGYNGGDKAWVDFIEFDLDGFQGFFRLEVSSDLTSHLSDGWDLEGSNQGQTKSGWDLVGHLMENGALVELEVVTRLKESFDLLEVDFTFTDHITEGFSDGFHAEWQHAEVLVFVFQVNVSLGTVGKGSLDGLKFLPQILQFDEWAGSLDASWRSDQDVFKVEFGPVTLGSQEFHEKSVQVLDGHTNGKQML